MNTDNTPSNISAVPSRLAGFSRRPVLTAIAIALVGGALAWQSGPSLAAESAVVIPAPAADLAAAGPGLETAVIAGGCFWGVQGVYQHVNGVTGAVSGYAGGDANTAKYDLVGSGRTGHAEAVLVTYDPRQISYGRILQIYFSVAHNPTELNRQGPDTGTQYRSTIFAQNEEQAKVAKAYIAQLDQTKKFGRPIATTIEMNRKFYPAEAYHQDYLTRNPNEPYILFNDIPKLDNLKRVFPERYRMAPALVGKKA